MAGYPHDRERTEKLREVKRLAGRTINQRATRTQPSVRTGHNPPLLPCFPGARSSPSRGKQAAARSMQPPQHHGLRSFERQGNPFPPQ